MFWKHTCLIHWCSENKWREERKPAKIQNLLIRKSSFNFVRISDKKIAIPLKLSMEVCWSVCLKWHCSVLIHLNQLCKIWEHAPEIWHLIKLSQKSIEKWKKGENSDCMLYFLSQVCTCFNFSGKNFKKKKVKGLIFSRQDTKMPWCPRQLLWKALTGTSVM